MVENKENGELEWWIEEWKKHKDFGLVVRTPIRALHSNDLRLIIGGCNFQSFLQPFGE